jgi:hypothetical protein
MALNKSQFSPLLIRSDPLNFINQQILFVFCIRSSNPQQASCDDNYGDGFIVSEIRDRKQKLCPADRNVRWPVNIYLTYQWMLVRMG